MDATTQDTAAAINRLRAAKNTLLALLPEDVRTSTTRRGKLRFPHLDPITADQLADPDVSGRALVGWDPADLPEGEPLLLAEDLAIAQSNLRDAVMHTRDSRDAIAADALAGALQMLDTWEQAHAATAPTPEPEQHADHTRALATDQLAALPPIGTRYTTPAGDHYTVAGYHCGTDLNETVPVLIDDDELGDTGIDIYFLDALTADEGPLTEIPAEPAITARATDTMRGHAEQHYEVRYTALADLPDVDTRLAYWRWAQADLEYRVAQRAMEDAARARARRLDHLVALTGSQQATARLTGLNQSSVSRALRSVEPDAAPMAP